MMIYMPNHGTQIFGSNPLEDGPSEFSQDTEDAEYTPIQIPSENHPPSPGSSKNSGESPVEQTTEPERENNNENSQETHDDEIENPQKSQNDKNKTPQVDTQKIPENLENNPLQEEPINTRGEKYNLRPNPNPNYSDTYRY